MCVFFFFFCKQKTAYEMRISDWSSDVCSSDLGCGAKHLYARVRSDRQLCRTLVAVDLADTHRDQRSPGPRAGGTAPAQAARRDVGRRAQRLSEQQEEWCEAGGKARRGGGAGPEQGEEGGGDKIGRGGGRERVGRGGE